MATPLIFCACLGIIGVFYVTLPFTQLLLVAMGGLLGVAMCQANHKPTKKASCAIYFNPDLLVSIEGNDITCIFPRAYGCGQKIQGDHLKQFNRCRANLQRFRDDKKKIRAHLRHMVELKMCSTCLDLEGIDDCINTCVKRWLIEVDHEVSAPTMQASEDHEHVPVPEKEDSASIYAEIHRPQLDGLTQNPPGAFIDVERPGPSQGLPIRTIKPSTRHKRHPSAELQALKITPSMPPHNTPKFPLPDAQSPLSQTTRPRLAKPPSPTTPCPFPRSNSTRPSIYIPGWCLVLYNVKKPETLHARISMNLQDKEIESGSIYILHRNDDEEYYKVGYSERDAQARLKEHIAKCGVDWEIVWTTNEPIKHAKRVERLIHLECGLRGIRYQENFCKNGGTLCNVQHREIVKAPYEDVKRCVKYWVAWMNNHDRYEEVANASSRVPRRRSSKGSNVPETTWKLTDAHEDLKIHNLNHEFCLTSTGEIWVQSPRQQKSSRRRKSVPVSLTPRRPSLLQDMRETQSARLAPISTPRHDAWSDNRLLSPSPTPSGIIESRRRGKLVERSKYAQDDNSPSGLFHNDIRMTDAQPTSLNERSDVRTWAEASNSPAPETSNARLRCGTCFRQCTGSSESCVAFLTPELDEEDPFVACER
jgi:hypothetical protein